MGVSMVGPYFLPQRFRFNAIRDLLIRRSYSAPAYTSLRASVLHQPSLPRPLGTSGEERNIWFLFDLRRVVVVSFHSSLQSIVHTPLSTMDPSLCGHHDDLVLHRER